MFRLSCNVIIGNFKPIKATALTWKRSIRNYTDIATIKLPSICMLKKQGDQYEGDRVETGLQFAEGMPVEIHAGYNGQNKTRFKGFISRINYNIPLELECEGYSYLLRKKTGINKSYSNTTVKQIATDLIEGTSIKLSDDIPNIPIPKVVFRNANGIQVLEFLKEKCLLTVYFDFDVLYIGLLQTNPKQVVKFRLGWNVIKDSELKFSANREFADVRIKLVNRQNDGTKLTSFYGPEDGNVVEKKISLIDDDTTLRAIAEQERNRVVNRGYEGGITAFLEPIVSPGDAAQLDDKKYPARAGKYFVEEVEGSFSVSGGRQKIKIGNSLGI